MGKKKEKKKEKERLKLEAEASGAGNADAAAHEARVEEIKRLNRVVGQIEGVKKMLEGERALDDILIQCKAVHSALKAVESRLLKIYLEDALDEIVQAEKKKPREQKIAELMDLYKPI